MQSHSDQKQLCHCLVTDLVGAGIDSKTTQGPKELLTQLFTKGEVFGTTFKAHKDSVSN